MLIPASPAERNLQVTILEILVLGKNSRDLRSLCALHWFPVPATAIDFDSSKEEDVITVLMCSAMVSARKPPKKKRRWRVCPCLHSREVACHVSHLLPKLCKHDKEYY